MYYVLYIIYCQYRGNGVALNGVVGSILMHIYSLQLQLPVNDKKDVWNSHVAKVEHAERIVTCTDVCDTNVLATAHLLIE